MLVCHLITLGAASRPAPALRFCSGSVCASYGAPLVLEAAEALTCGADCNVKVATATCMKACNKVPLDGVAVFSNGVQALLDPCTANPEAALRTAFGALDEPRLEPMRLAFASKLQGDTALDSGDYAGAIRAFSVAIDGAPSGFIETIQQASTEAAPPPSLKGLGPSRLATALSKERERTTPGNVRWLFQALVGRARAQLGAKSGCRSAVQDAKQATLLCPLSPIGWETLSVAASAVGDTALAEQASERASATRPEGMPEDVPSVMNVVSTSSSPGEVDAGQRSSSTTRAGLAYGLAIAGIVSVIAYRKQPGNSVSERQQ